MTKTEYTVFTDHSDDPKVEDIRYHISRKPSKYTKETVCGYRPGERFVYSSGHPVRGFTDESLSRSLLYDKGWSVCRECREMAELILNPDMEIMHD